MSAKELAKGKYAGADIRTLSSSTFENGTLTMNFTTVTSLEAGKPYLIRWQVDPYIPFDGRSNENTCSDIAFPEFPKVTVPAGYADGSITTDWVDFIGVTSPFAMPAYDTSKLFLSTRNGQDGVNENYLWYPGNSSCIQSCRAYFQLKNGLCMDRDGGAYGDPGKSYAPQRIVMNIDGESITTDLRSPDFVSEQGKASGEEQVEKFIQNGHLLIRRAGITYDALGRKIK